MTLSIILPAYNAEPYLERCFDSIYHDAPSMDEFEVIVVNDGSKDNTLSLIKDYQAKYSNLVVIDQTNGGVSVARNNGISSAKGDYVLFLDADDELVDGALTKVYTYLKGHEPMDMLVTRQIRRTAEREWMRGTSRLEEHIRYTGVEAYKRGYIRTNAGGGICRTSFLREYDLRFPEGVNNAEDTVFFGLLQVYVQSIVYYNLPLYIINQMDGSASRIRDYTRLGKSHAFTMRVVADIKPSLIGSREQKSIFDYVVYQLLSNTVSDYVRSKELSYLQLKKDVDLQRLLPIDTTNMYQMRKNARLMNLSFPLFYLLSWIKHCYIRQ